MKKLEAEQLKVEQHDDELYYDLHDPAALILGLMHVRAPDAIRISYDFVRDGWTIEQASVFKPAPVDRDWQEVAFVQAWGRYAEPA